MKISIAQSTEEIKKCFPVMVQLRPSFTEEKFVEQVERQKKEGYTLAFVEDSEKVVAVAGFRINESLYAGKFMYIDDLVTDEQSRSKGYGDKLFDFLVEHAKEEGCKTLQLDSGVQRFDAHRFYLRKRMIIASHHFGLEL